MTIRESLKRFRKDFNLTRNEVAEVLGIKPQSYIYEVKDVTPSAQVILDLADHYNVSADYLLGRTDNPYLSKIENTEEDTENETIDIAALQSKVNKIESALSAQGIKI